MLNQRKTAFTVITIYHYVHTVTIVLHVLLDGCIGRCLPYVTYKNVSVTKIRLDLFSKQ